MGKDKYDEIFEKVWCRAPWYFRWTVRRQNARLWFFEGLLQGAKVVNKAVRKNVEVKSKL